MRKSKGNYFIVITWKTHEEIQPAASSFSQTLSAE